MNAMSLSMGFGMGIFLPLCPDYVVSNYGWGVVFVKPFQCCHDFFIREHFIKFRVGCIEAFDVFSEYLQLGALDIIVSTAVD